MSPPTTPTHWTCLGSSASSPEPTDLVPPGARHLLFRVAGTLYAFDVAQVREIVRTVPATRYPGAPPFVRGIMNLRGEVLTVVDLGVRLVPGREPVEGGRLVVVEVDERRLAVAVDEVLEVREIPEDGPSGASKNGGADGTPELTRPLGHLDGQIVLLVDLSALVSEALT